MIRRNLLRALSLGALSCGGIRVRAQSYPSRPVTLLVGGAPGSVPDLMIRPIADCAARIETLLVWNRAYKNPALMNFVTVARRVIAAQQ